jgi:hypothetical protein
MAGRALWAFVGAGGIGVLVIAYRVITTAAGK